MTKSQRKNGTDRDVIIQTFMLIESGQDQDFVSFRNKDIDVFVSDRADKISGNTFVTLQEAMDALDGAFDTIKIPVTSVPMVLYCAYRVKKDKKSFTKLVDIINKFLADYDTNEEYKQYVTSGTSGAENVRGRFDYWKGLIKAV